MSSQGCSDGNCKLRIGPRPGQHTNGGCHCLRDIPTARRIEIERKLHSIKAFNAELLAAMKETSATLHLADSEAMQLPQPRLLLFPVDRANQLIVMRDLDAAISKAEVSDE